ncbi:MAG: methyltransferase domain-containing protein [bacterium]
MTHEYPAQFARFYDVIYHHARDGVDNEFYLDKIRQTNGKVLEIGVGTGRFFMDALALGADITGIDISPTMLNVLKTKLSPEQHQRISRQSIVDFHFDERFDLIIAPFRVFMHLLEKEEQIAALNNVYRHLNPGGRFIFDTFAPNLKQLIEGLDQQVDFDGDYEPGKRLKRIVSTKPDLIRQLINIHFRLEWDEDHQTMFEDWDFPLRYFFRYELEHLVERSDFAEYKIMGDFEGHELSQNSKEFIVICRK